VPNNNPNLDELKTFYANWNKNHSLDSNEKYIFVVLPGDAPTNKNVMRYFTKDSAIELAKKVKKLWEKLGKTHTIVVHNSPRTGKHDPISAKVICTHQVEGKEYSISKPDDYISKIFMAQLQEWKLPTKFYRFVFEINEGKQKPISGLNAFYYLLSKNSANILVLPGESVSMMGQAPLYANTNQIIVFQPSSMNEVHEKLMNLGLEEGYFCKFDELDNTSKQKNSPKKFTSDSKKVARHIWQGMFKKFCTN
jgi:hypothetical protein